MEKILAPSVFGTAADHCTTRLDLGGLAALRMHTEGARALAICRLIEAQTYLAKTSKDKGPAPALAIERARSVLSGVAELSRYDQRSLAFGSSSSIGAPLAASLARRKFG